MRGGLVYFDELAKSTTAETMSIVTATRGNHGQSIPFAARLHHIPVKVHVPQGNSVEKNAAMRGWGAEVITHGRDFEEARLEAVRVAEEEGAHLIPPYAEPLVRGVATYALELFEARPDLDRVYVPVGMGSGICGLITVRDLLGLNTEIVGVVADKAPAFALSFEAGKVVETSNCSTFADGIASRAPWEEPLSIIRQGASHIARVTEDEIANAMRIYFTDTHNVAEGAGAAPLAAALKDREKIQGKNIGVILCGGNVDSSVFLRVLSGETPTA